MQRIFSTLQIEKVGKCGLIRLNRPQKYNAISIEMFQEIPQGELLFLKDRVFNPIQSSSNNK